MKTSIAAAIDIGSNSLLLCIAEKDPSSADGIKILKNETRVVGLAKGLQQGSEISNQSLSRAQNALEDYRKILAQHKNPPLRAVATEGLRRASNAGEVQAKLSSTLEQPIKIISGEREAELSFQSVQKAHSDQHRNKIVFDVGGASTEIAIGNHEGILKWSSLKVGSVLLTEKFGLNQSSLHKKNDAIDYVRSLIQREGFETRPLDLGVGVAGTITCLIAVNQQLSEFDRDKVHLAKLSKIDLSKITDHVLELDPNQRESIVGLPSDRADVFGGGCCIVSAILDFFEWPELICMDSGVRLGLIYEMLL